MIITLTSKKYGKIKIQVEDDTPADILNDKWYITKQSDGNFRVIKCWYVGDYKSKTVYLSRVIMNAKRGEVVDHINGDPLDNRKSNLRICTHKQNCRNVKMHKNNTTGYKGVHLIKASGKYRAYIVFNGKQIQIGMFTCRKKAAEAYNEAAIKYHGEFARLNTIKK